MYYTYILKSKKNGKFYIGSCEHIDSRLERHNAGATSSTKHARPWELVYAEEFLTRSEAIKRENQIKSKKSRKYIEYLIDGSDG